MTIKWGTTAAVGLTGLAIAGAPVCSLFVKDKNGTIHQGWLYGQLGFVLAAAAIPFIAGLISKKRDKAARAVARLQMSRTVGPILWNIMEHTIADPKGGADGVISDVVNAAAHIVGPAGEDLETRVCYYELVQENGVSRLEFKKSVGRDHQPMTAFDPKSDRGKHAIELATNRGTILVENVKTKRKKKRALMPPGWSDDGDTSYKTFISAGVKAPEMAYGMLSVDAPKPGDLSEYDESVVKLLALILALGRTIPDAFADHLKKAAGPVGTKP